MKIAIFDAILCCLSFQIVHLAFLLNECLSWSELILDII